LWTIIVGATFGTINARGVDGNQKFDRDSVRKGVVLVLGIGLGVMGLIGTGIYARQELTKIILAEQASEQAVTSTDEEAAERPHSSHEEIMLTQNDNSLTSLHDLENPQLGDDEAANHESFLDNSEVSFVDQRRDHTPWSPEAIALELPIVPNIFRRRVNSCEFDSPCKNNDNNAPDLQHDLNNVNRTTSNAESNSKQHSKPFELHLGERILDEIPYKWEKRENNRYHFVKGNRPRCNTDPISGHSEICQISSSLREGDDERNCKKERELSIRRLHSMADFESLRGSALDDQIGSSPGTQQKEDADEGLDREWFWIWD
jgi:hypothetical protein